MPLDVRPLSLTRRIVSIALMLGLLGGSLAFAQWLVVRQSGGGNSRTVAMTPAAIRVTFIQPDDTSDALEATDSPFDEPMKPAHLSAPQGRRRLFALSFDADESRLGEYQAKMIDSILPPGVLTNRVEAGPPIAGFTGQQTEAISISGTGPSVRSSFVIIRMTDINSHIVAFCLSGTGPITDADRKFVDDFCKTNIVISTGDSKRKG